MMSSAVEIDRVAIVELALSNVYDMRSWEHHDNPLFYNYNFPRLNDEEIKEWFKIKTKQRNKKSFAILDESNKTIGFATIKDISRIRKSAELGIVFDPKYMNMGYGTKALRKILEYFFYKMNMKTMFLDVAMFNKRAIRCYEKCGFHIIKEFDEKLEDQRINIFNEERFKDIRQCFFQNKGLTYVKFFKMRVDKISIE